MRKEIIERLLELSGDDEWIVRGSAVMSIGKLSDVTAKDMQDKITVHLLRIIDDEYWNVRSSVIWAFGRLGMRA